MSRPTVTPTLAGRLRRGFGLVTLFVALTGAFGVLGLQASAARIEQLSLVLTPAVEANARALQLMLDAETAVRGYQLGRRAELLEPYEAARSEVTAELERAEELGRRAGVDADYVAAQESAVAWLDGFAAPVVAGSSSFSASPLVGKTVFDRFREDQGAVAAALTDRRTEVRAEARTVRAVVTPGLVALTLLCVTIAARVASGGVRSVATPLAELRLVLDRLRLGDHTARAGTDGPAEVSAVAAAANALADESDELRAEQAAAALLRQRTREAVRRVRDELGREHVLQSAAEVLGELIGADRVLVRQLEKGRGAPGRPGSAREVQWARPGLAPVPHIPEATPEETSEVRRLDREDEVTVLADLEQARAAGLLTAALLLGVVPTARAALVAPVDGGDEGIAVAVLLFEQPRDTGDEEVQAVQIVCADLGRALEQSGIFERQLHLVDRLQELDRQKSDFISTVSHELRTPLTSIAGYTELLREGAAGELSPRMASMVEVIDRNAERLRALIDDLLTLSRIEAGTLTRTRTDVDLAEVVAGAARALAPQAAAGGVSLDLPAPDGPVTVTGDAGQLERVVLNLLSNAVKFTPSGGVVTVRLDGGPPVLLEVRDTGIGIPESEVDQLSSRFFRASNAVAAAVPGTGLGLSIVRGILDLHGGDLVISSAPGRGTTVLARLPATPPEPGGGSDGGADGAAAVAG